MRRAAGQPGPDRRRPGRSLASSTGTTGPAAASIGGSSRQDTAGDVTPGQQADDVHRLLSALGSEPAHVFGSSGGAVVGLALVTAPPRPGGHAGCPRASRGRAAA